MKTETVISKINKKLWFCSKKMKQYSGFNPKNDNIYMAYVKKFKKLKKEYERLTTDYEFDFDNIDNDVAILSHPYFNILNVKIVIGDSVRYTSNTEHAKFIADSYISRHFPHEDVLIYNTISDRLSSQKLVFIGDCNVDGGALRFIVDKFGSYGNWITNGTITYTGWCDKI